MADESTTTTASSDTVEKSTTSADDTSADRGLEERLGQVELDSR